MPDGIIEKGGTSFKLAWPKGFDRQSSVYLVQLTFFGVSEVRETLLSQGYRVMGRDPSDRSWMQSFIFEIDDIRVVKVGADLFGFYLRTKELQLDFNFVDCMHYEVGA